MERIGAACQKVLRAYEDGLAGFVQPKNGDVTVLVVQPDDKRVQAAIASGTFVLGFEFRLNSPHQPDSLEEEDAVASGDEDERSSICSSQAPSTSGRGVKQMPDSPLMFVVLGCSLPPPKPGWHSVTALQVDCDARQWTVVHLLFTGRGRLASIVPLSSPTDDVRLEPGDWAEVVVEARRGKVITLKSCGKTLIAGHDAHRSLALARTKGAASPLLGVQPYSGSTLAQPPGPLCGMVGLGVLNGRGDFRTWKLTDPVLAAAEAAGPSPRASSQGQGINRSASGSSSGSRGVVYSLDRSAYDARGNRTAMLRHSSLSGGLGGAAPSPPASVCGSAYTQHRGSGASSSSLNSTARSSSTRSLAPTDGGGQHEQDYWDDEDPYNPQYEHPEEDEDWSRGSRQWLRDQGEAGPSGFGAYPPGSGAGVDHYGPDGLRRSASYNNGGQRSGNGNGSVGAGQRGWGGVPRPLEGPGPQRAAAAFGPRMSAHERTAVAISAPYKKFSRKPYVQDVDPGLVETIMNEIIKHNTGVGFDDVVSLDRAKQLLGEAVLLPLVMPEVFTGALEPWHGVLLFGPPGNGKTMLAKAIAASAGITFFSVSSASMTSKWRGDSEKLVRVLFAVAEHYSPSVIFIDEVDALVGSRDMEGEAEASRRFKSELLQQMDGLTSRPGKGRQQSATCANGVLVLAASNCPWDLDAALRRRLEKRIFIPLPDATARRALLERGLAGARLEEGVDLTQLAEKLEGYSGADIKLICRDALLAPIRRLTAGLSPDQYLAALRPQRGGGGKGVLVGGGAAAAALAGLAPQAGGEGGGPLVTAGDLEASVAAIRPSVSAAQMKRYEDWDRQFAAA